MSDSSGNMSSNSPQGNNWTIYLGTVVEDKEKDSRTIKVHLQELLPFVTGEVTSVDDVKSIGDQQQVETSNYHEATYFEGFTNRSFPPDIRKNEQVFVFNYADSDTYYWMSTGRDDKLRPNERYRISVSASGKAGTELNEENTYYLEIDTLHGNTITISTSKANGEKYRYLFKIDSDNNNLKICDDNDNEILLESETPRIRLRNHDGTMIDLIQKNLLLIVPEDFILKVGRQAVFDVPNFTFKNTDNGGATVWNVAKMNVNASDTFNVNGKCIGLHGAVEATSLVAGPIKASAYLTGGIGSEYKSAKIDVSSGESSGANNSPKSLNVDDYNSLRHAAAWEQVSQAITLLADCLETLSSCSGSCDQARTLAQQAKMLLNKGE